MGAGWKERRGRSMSLLFKKGRCRMTNRKGRDEERRVKEQLTD
jgi:hypothetical protein